MDTYQLSPVIMRIKFLVATNRLVPKPDQLLPFSQDPGHSVGALCCHWPVLQWPSTPNPKELWRLRTVMPSQTGPNFLIMVTSWEVSDASAASQAKHPLGHFELCLISFPPLPSPPCAILRTESSKVCFSHLTFNKIEAKWRDGIH